MASTINASTSAGVVTTADTTGNLNLQSNGTTIVALTSAGAAVTGTLTGSSTMFSPITNSLSGNVALSDTALYFDGPTVAQGTVGTWFVSGTVTCGTTSGAAFLAKLWDGTTVIASAEADIASSSNECISLSGFITSPAGNLRISVRDNTTTAGSIKFNATGNSKDSTITAIRIG
jgi:hypothetical protein